MHELLKDRLKAYILQNNPDLLHNLQVEYKFSAYLEDKVSNAMPTVMRLLGEGKPGYVIEELVLNELTADLRPSCFNYIKSVLQEDFPADYLRFYQQGVLTYEAISLVEECREIFSAFSFAAATVNDNLLRYAVIAQIHEHLN